MANDFFYPKVPAMKIAISGASGLIGSRISHDLTAKGHEIYSISRKKSSEKGAIFWNPSTGELDAAALEGLDAIVHLAGESIASGRWNEVVKKRIWDSRVEGTALLVRTLTTLKHPPKVLLCASAIGVYGDCGDAWLTEDSPGDESFLSRLCQAWEAAAIKAESSGIRVVCVRIGVVVAKDGGALKSMLIPFKMGLGGVVGSGKQYLSWITLNDLSRVFSHCLECETLRGPVNGVSPSPVTNKTWTRALGKVLHRPTLFPLPAFMVRALMGEMGEALLLSSARVKPCRLLDSGFAFGHTDIEAAFADVLSPTNAKVVD